MDSPAVSPSELIRNARQGDPNTLNELINQYRPYLKLLARLQHDRRLFPKLDDSDLVQEVTALVACNFTAFRGETEVEFTAWLRTSMTRVIAQSLRHYTRARRDIHVEQRLQRSIDESSALIATHAVATAEATPSEHLMQRERAVSVAKAIDQLPEHYQEVIILRSFKGLTLDEVGKRTGRSADSVRKIWARAVLMIRQSLEGKL